MKILNICAYTWAIGGPARTIYDHTTEAIRNGHEVTIASPMTVGEKLYDVPEGARVVVCPRTTPISYFFNEFSLELCSFLKNHIHEYDIVHIHGIWHFGSLAPFLVNSKVPKVITIHGLLDQWALNHSKWKKKLVSFLFQKRLLASANLIHVLNADEKQDVINYLGHTPKSMVIIPNGMQFEEYKVLPPRGSFRNSLNIPSEKKLVLFMGRLNIKKGLDLLLPAFKQYLSRNNDAILILAGPDDGYQSEVEAFLVENDLGESVKLVGMLTGDVKKSALVDSDIFVLPSYSEGFSIAVLEAMICGVPALISDRVGFAEYIKKYNAAHICGLTEEAVERGLVDLLGNEEYRQSLLENAQRMVFDNFNIAVVAKKILAEYQKLKSTN